MADSTPLLKAVDLHKTYSVSRRDLEVLRGVDLTVAAGEFAALRGASGAGKSTLLHLLGGLDRPLRGTIEFKGRDLASFSANALAEFRGREVGFIFQSYHLLPEFDALENVGLAARIRRHDAGETRRRATELLERVGLSQRLDHMPPELSGGEQQRVAIARALINEPSIILADEPTGNLDSATGDEILDLLCSLRDERNMALLIATHSDTVAARAQRVIHIEDGKLAE
jgi:ABC-type lipoprotein export system ATPase subunit